MKTNKLLAAILVLNALVLIGQWTGHGYLPAASAQIPDPANRQMQMIDELKQSNDKLDQIIGILKGGDLQVKVEQSDDSKGGHSAHGK